MADEFLMQFWAATVGAAFSAGAHAFENMLADPGLEKWIKQYDVVYAVWRDPESPNGFSIIAIHGFERIGEDSGNLRMNALPCIDRAAAEKLLGRFGDPKWPPQIPYGGAKRN